MSTKRASSRNKNSNKNSNNNKNNNKHDIRRSSTMEDTYLDDVDVDTDADVDADVDLDLEIEYGDYDPAEEQTRSNRKTTKPTKANINTTTTNNNSSNRDRDRNPKQQQQQQEYQKNTSSSSSSSSPVYYHPYETSVLDAPMAHLIMAPCLPYMRPMMEGMFRFRWLLSRPLEVRILPKYIPPFFNKLGNVTVGDVLMLLPIFILIFAGYNQTFLLPSIEGSGLLASYAIYWTFLCANKANSIVAFLFGIPFERMIYHHYLASLMTIVLGGLHTYVAFAYSDGDTGTTSTTSSSTSNNNRRHLSSDEAANGGTKSMYALHGSSPSLLSYLFDGQNNWSGFFLFLSLLLLVMTSLFRIFRQRFFEVWLTMHVMLAVGVVVFCVLHNVTFILFLALWWGVDLFVRYGIMASCRYPTQAKLRLIRPDVVQVKFPKPMGFQYNPGQFIQIAICNISYFQFHPISISSAPHEDHVTLHIRALGDWSRQLKALVERHESTRETTITHSNHNNKSDNSDDDLTVQIRLEGPYGSLSVDLDDYTRYKHVLLVCGGIGVTHCQSVGKAIQYQTRRQQRPMQKMKLVWAVRDLDMVRDIPPLHDSKLRRRKKSSKITKDIYCTTTKSKRHAPSRENNSTYLEDGRTDEVIEEQEEGLPSDVTLYKSRPDFDQILTKMKQDAVDAGEMNIAVFGCGPAPLINSLQEACRKHSMSMAQCGGVFFDVHVEHFDF